MFIIAKIQLRYLILILHGIAVSIALQITNINVPNIVDLRDSVSLSCSYNLGSDKLHSVKWYKDDQEFFRYAPHMENKVMTFLVDGIHLTEDPYDNCTEVRCRITLDSLNTYSSGSYRCEVSGDAPAFRISFEVSNMTVIALPRHEPKITGVGYRYEIGDIVVANCSSDASYPASNLAWYINDIKVPYEYLQPMMEQVIDSDGFRLFSRSLEVKFQLQRVFFTENSARVKLKCVSHVREKPTIIKESVVTIYVPSMDQLSNQKLINWRSDAKTQHKGRSIVITLVIIYSICLLYQVLSDAGYLDL